MSDLNSRIQNSAKSQLSSSYSQNPRHGSVPDLKDQQITNLEPSTLIPKGWILDQTEGLSRAQLQRLVDKGVNLICTWGKHKKSYSPDKPPIKQKVFATIQKEDFKSRCAFPNEQKFYPQDQQYWGKTDVHPLSVTQADFPAHDVKPPPKDPIPVEKSVKLYDYRRQRRDYPDLGPRDVPSRIRYRNTWEHGTTHSKTLNSTYAHSYANLGGKKAPQFQQQINKNTIGNYFPDPVTSTNKELHRSHAYLPDRSGFQKIHAFDRLNMTTSGIETSITKQDFIDPHKQFVGICPLDHPAVPFQPYWKHKQGLCICHKCTCGKHTCVHDTMDSSLQDLLKTHDGTFQKNESRPISSMTGKKLVKNEIKRLFDKKSVTEAKLNLKDPSAQQTKQARFAQTTGAWYMTDGSTKVQKESKLKPIALGQSKTVAILKPSGKISPAPTTSSMTLSKELGSTPSVSEKYSKFNNDKLVAKGLSHKQVRAIADAEITKGTGFRSEYDKRFAGNQRKSFTEMPGPIENAEINRGIDHRGKYAKTQNRFNVKKDSVAENKRNSLDEGQKLIEKEDIDRVIDHRGKYAKTQTTWKQDDSVTKGTKLVNSKSAAEIKRNSISELQKKQNEAGKKGVGFRPGNAKPIAENKRHSVAGSQGQIENEEDERIFDHRGKYSKTNAKKQAK